MIPKNTAFLAAYCLTASISLAAKAAKIDRSLHYRWLQDDPEYVTAFAAAQEQAGQSIEDMAVKRAMQGVDEYVMYHGKVCMRGKKPLVITRYSDALTITLLKRFMPDRYRERGSVEVTGAGGGPLEIVERLNAGRDRLAALKNEADESTTTASLNL